MRSGVQAGLGADCAVVRQVYESSKQVLRFTKGTPLNRSKVNYLDFFMARDRPPAVDENRRGDSRTSEDDQAIGYIFSAIVACLEVKHHLLFLRSRSRSRVSSSALRASQGFTLLWRACSSARSSRPLKAILTFRQLIGSLIALLTADLASSAAFSASSTRFSSLPTTSRCCSITRLRRAISSCFRFFASSFCRSAMYSVKV
jgi:hypothetical protein